MNLVVVVLAAATCLLIAYRVYGRLLARLVKLDDSQITPAHTMRDDVDYAPIEPKFLLSQHFSAIAAAGPVVGPILAAVYWGWLPAVIWILIGSIFIGGVHDFMSLVASVRHRARSIAEVLREHMSRRSYALFLLFVWIALVYIVVAFTDLVAGSFVGTQILGHDETAAVMSEGSATTAPSADSITIEGGAIASSSLLYLALPIVMGLLLRYTRLSVGWATVIFLPLVATAIWAGRYVPFDLAAILDVSEAQARQIWGYLLLGYCFIASLVPLWLLLQPRGHLGGYFLFAALLGGIVGILFGGFEVKSEAFRGFTSPNGLPLFPMLFIFVACGACSGFHCLIASGTTSKQLRRESDARGIGYGAMLLEAMVAVISVGCVMIVATDSPLLSQNPNVIYGHGLGSLLSTAGIPLTFGVAFGLLAFTTFVYDTLDVCTRLGRFIIQELTGMSGVAGRWLGTALTAGVPLIFLSQTAVDGSGKVIPAWSVFWPLFGASNQLLAALALVGLTVWLRRTYRARWVWFVTGLPAVLMLVMSGWALWRFVQTGFAGFAERGSLDALPRGPVPWAALVLLALAVLIVVEAARAFRRCASNKQDITLNMDDGAVA